MTVSDDHISIISLKFPFSQKKNCGMQLVINLFFISMHTGYFRLLQITLGSYTLCCSRFLKIRVCFSAKNCPWIQTPGHYLRCRLYKLAPSKTSQTESGQMCVKEVIWSPACMLDNNTGTHHCKFCPKSLQRNATLEDTQFKCTRSMKVY